MTTIITVRVEHDRPEIVNHACVAIRKMMELLFKTLNVNVWTE
jgi:hypothetical protein